jgi:hypothetical protein
MSNVKRVVTIALIVAVLTVGGTSFSNAGNIKPPPDIHDLCVDAFAPAPLNDHKDLCPKPPPLPIPPPPI